MAERYPLTWPSDQPRTPPGRRRESDFKVELGRARDDLLDELRRLGAREVILSTSIPVRLDGLPYATAREPDDPGVAVYFTHDKRQLVIACDSYRRVRENIRAVSATVEALRTIKRHGATQLLERAFTGFTALPPAGGGSRHWSEVLGVARTAGFDQVKAAYRALAAQHHPDRGGDHDTMARFTEAYEAAQKELGR